MQTKEGIVDPPDYCNSLASGTHPSSTELDADELASGTHSSGTEPYDDEGESRSPALPSSLTSPTSSTASHIKPFST
jgi:hypothetical protein